MAAKNAAPKKTDAVRIGRNIETHVEDRTLIIRINLDAESVRSAGGTGKMMLLAGTSGFTDVPDTNGLRINLNLGSKA
jgi:hypothetical protein